MRPDLTPIKVLRPQMESTLVKIDYEFYDAYLRLKNEIQDNETRLRLLESRYHSLHDFIITILREDNHNGKHRAHTN